MVIIMLEPILQGFIEWLYTIFVDTADYVFGDLMDVLTMDMTYFKKVAPVVTDIAAIIRALGWAMLISNLVFQSLKSMMPVGFEGEDPRLLFTRGFVFSFLLLASDQICEICMQMTRRVVTLLSMSSTFKIALPTAAYFSGIAVSWMLVAIVGIILTIQLIKLFVDIGERYVITCVLTFMAPLAFALGASRNTSDIFKGWCRMYGSMNLMLIMNIVFLKLIISAMAHMVSSGVILWVVFIVALTRVARKIDAHIAKLGLNPAQTGSSLGVRLPGAMTMVVVKSLASMVGKSAGASRSGAGGGNPPPGGNGYRGRKTGPVPPNGGNSAAGADVDVNVSSQSRGARVNVPGGSASTVHNSNQFNTNSQSKYANSSTNGESARCDSSGSSNSSRVQNQTQSAPKEAAPSRPPLSRNTVGMSQAQHYNSQQNLSSDANMNSTVRNSAPANPQLNIPGSGNDTSANPVNASYHSDTNTPLNRTGTSMNTQYASNNSPAKNESREDAVNVPAPGGSRNATVPIVSVPTASAHIGSKHTDSVNKTTASTQSISNSNVDGGSDVSSGDKTSYTATVGSNSNTTSTSHALFQASPAGANGSHVRIIHSPDIYNSKTIGTSSPTGISVPQQRIDHTHQHGRYDPAASNRKGHRYYFTKATETTKSSHEQIRRGDTYGEPAEKRKRRGSSRRTDD